MSKHPNQKIALVLALFITSAACPADASTSRVEQHSYDSFGSSGAEISLSAGNNHDVTIVEVARQLIEPHSSGSTITGLDKTYYNDGEALWIQNVAATAALRFAHQHNGSESDHQLALPSAQDLELEPNEVAIFNRDEYTGQWASALPPAVRGIVMTSQPSRSFNSPFQLPKLTWVSYVGRIETTLSLSGGARGQIVLYSGSSNPPTEVCDRLAGGSTGTLTIGLNITSTVDGALQCLVKAGDFVEIDTVTESGTPTFSLVSGQQIEKRLR